MSSRYIDADALIKYCDDNWIALNVDAVNVQPTNENSSNTLDALDCVSREAVVSVIQSLHIPSGTEKVMAIRKIKNMPSAQPEQRWIPCSERLPNNDGEYVLFCDIDGDEYVGWYNGFNWWTICEDVKDVIAWQPLPEPYREDDDEIARKEPCCRECKHLTGFAGNYSECVLLHAFVDYYYWNSGETSPKECPLREDGEVDDR